MLQLLSPGANIWLVANRRIREIFIRARLADGRTEMEYHKLNRREFIAAGAAGAAAIGVAARSEIARPAAGIVKR